MDQTAETPRKTVSLFEVLATLPSGAIGIGPLDLDEMTRYLQAQYATPEEQARNQRHAVRDELYRDGGESTMRTLIEDQFRDATVKELRKKWVPYARFNNVSRRIVNELSTVYSEPAKRFVDDATNPIYQDLLAMVRIDERMVEASRLLNLHRALLVGFRVRVKPNLEREAVLDVVTPANARAIMHPNDNTLVVAWMIRTSYRTARGLGDEPKWTVWSDHESFQLREDLSVIGGSVQVHELGVCPWVPVVLGPPSPGFWPGFEGEDIKAAHLAIWFNNVLLLKESKSATKQTIITGDGTSTPRGQAADSEVPGELADGQSVNTVDMSMDLDMFSSTTNHILQHVAQNYGLSPALVEHQGVQSAEARELMRLPLREIRRQQQVPLRQFERELCVVMSAVCKVDLPSMTFDPSGFRIEFSESETPLDPIAEQTLFEKRRTAGLDNTVAMWMRSHPDATPDEAKSAIEENYLLETWRVDLMKELMALNGSTSSAPGEASAKENGAAGPAATEDQPSEDPAVDPAAAE